jgi:dTDP-4-dehydrorhamnose 3,5-epimerase
MKIIKTKFKGLKIIKSKVFYDKRGYFREIAKKKILNNNFLFDCMSQSKKNVLRGLHFQKKNPQAKLITVVYGKIFDVAVDLRKNSKTFGEYFSIILSDNAGISIVIPEGFAHGFQVLSPECEIVYLHTADYEPISEGGINALDKRLSIDWPKTVKNRSERDISHAMLNENFIGLELK